MYPQRVFPHVRPHNEHEHEPTEWTSVVSFPASKHEDQSCISYSDGKSRCVRLVPHKYSSPYFEPEKRKCGRGPVVSDFSDTQIQIMKDLWHFLGSNNMLGNCVPQILCNLQSSIIVIITYWLKESWPLCRYRWPELNIRWKEAGGFSRHRNY